jgi:hypothetical protein
MTPGANVHSITALHEWLGALSTYKSECDESLSGIRLEIQRGFAWIEEQLRLWQQAIRHCEEDVVQAKAALAAKRFPDWSGKMPDTTVEERNLRRAQARLDEAVHRVTLCRKWLVQLPRMIDEHFTGASQGLQVFLETDLARSMAQLTRQVEALEAYAGLRRDLAPPTRTDG